MGPQVDALRYLDFIQYIIGINAEREARKKAQAELNKQGGV